MLLIVFAPWIIRLLLSEEFLSIHRLVQLIAYSFVFRVMWLTLSYIALAKGDKKVYLVYDALIGNGGYMLLNIAFYYFWGLQGLGISCVIGTIAVSTLLLAVYGHRYHFAYSRGFWRVQAGCAVFLTLVMALEFLAPTTIRIATEAVAGLLFAAYVYRALDKRIQLHLLIKTQIQRFKHQ